jgi:limonene-1,2-epoxide hydrolase
MGQRQEAVVRSLLDSFTVGNPDEIVEHFTVDAKWNVVASREPLVGKSAIRRDLDRQAAVYTDFRHEIVNTASTDSIVFVERVDMMRMDGKDVSVHITGVFEVDGDKIRAWREYLDMKEVEAQLV